MAEDSLASHVDCGAGTEAGFCAMTSSYPRARLVLLAITECYLSCAQGGGSGAEAGLRGRGGLLERGGERGPRQPRGQQPQRDRQPPGAGLAT